MKKNSKKITKELRFMFPTRLYIIFLLINYKNKSMKHYHIVWIIKFLQKLEKIHLIQSLKCSFKIRFTTYQQFLRKIWQESKRNCNQSVKIIIK